MKILIMILFGCCIFYLGISHVPTQKSNTIALINYSDPYTMIKEAQTLLKEGDLVVRLNEDPTSQIIKNFNRHDKRYSHAGIVLYENGYPYIYHILNGEENPGEKLKPDSLSRFCNPRKNIAFGIFRYNIKETEIKNLKTLIHRWFAKGVQFDSTFNLKTDDKMYCSEMISKALARATNKRILIETTKLTPIEADFFSTYSHLPFAYTSKLKVVPIDELYTHSCCQLIKEYNYEITH